MLRSFLQGSWIMTRASEFRFFVPRDAVERVTLARFRVTQRKAGLPMIGGVCGAMTVVCGALVAAARLGVAAAGRWLPLVAFLAAMSVAALVIATASRFVWQRRLARALRAADLALPAPLAA
jgi:hypothetical protein